MIFSKFFLQYLFLKMSILKPRNNILYNYTFITFVVWQFHACNYCMKIQGILPSFSSPQPLSNVLHRPTHFPKNLSYSQVYFLWHTEFNLNSWDKYRFGSICWQAVSLAVLTSSGSCFTCSVGCLPSLRR